MLLDESIDVDCLISLAYYIKSKIFYVRHTQSLNQFKRMFPLKKQANKQELINLVKTPFLRATYILLRHSRKVHKCFIYFSKVGLKMPLNRI